MCQYGTKLAPNLKPVHECTVIPQETCNLKFTPPRKEQKPLISEWCQDDSPPVPDQVGVAAYTQYVLQGTGYKGQPSKTLVFFAQKLSKMYTEK